MVEVIEAEEVEGVEDVVVSTPRSSTMTAMGSEEERPRRLTVLSLLLRRACKTRGARRRPLVLPLWLPRSSRRSCSIEISESGFFYRGEKN